MEALDVEFGNFEGNFEPDAFYESFLAPKFHDFTAPEEPIDPDAFFKGKPGMTKKEAMFAAVAEQKAMESPKILKVTAHDSAKTPGSAAHVPLKTPVAAEKAVSAGSAKKVRGPISTPLSSKILKSGNSAYNSPSTTPLQSVVEKLTGSLKPMSLVKRLQASENDDPNSTTSNFSDVTPTKAGKTTRMVPAAASEDKPLARSRSQKVLEPKSVSLEPISTPVPKETTALIENLCNGGKDNDLMKGTDNKGTPQKKDTSCRLGVAGVGVTGTPKLLKSKSAGREQMLGAITSISCKTPVKEPGSTQPELKKVAATAEAVGSPYGGHHCKSSRCAANDPNYASPASITTKKFLIARRGTPGSVKRATPNPARAEAQKGGEVSVGCSDNSACPTDDTTKEKSVVVRSTVEGAVEHVHKPEESTSARSIEKIEGDKASNSMEHIPANGKADAKSNSQTQNETQVALEEVFQKLVLEVQPLEQEAKQDCSVSTSSAKTSRPEEEEFKEIPLNECTSLPTEQQVQESAASISAGDAGDRSGCMAVNESKDLSRSDETTMTKATAKTEISSTVSEAEGMALFLKVASECLENLDMDKIDGTPMSEAAAVKEPSPATSRPEGEDLFLKVASQCLENFDMEKLEIPQPQIGRKRKSQEMGIVNDSKKANCASDDPVQPTVQKVKESAAPCLPKLRKRVTSPRPFRLRTQERGVLKEIEFNKKMEEYIAAKDGFHSAFQGLSAVEPKIVGKPIKICAQPGHVFCAKRPDPCEQDENDEKAQKLIIAQKAPLFDRPFKPHRSTKKLTVPQEPKFHQTRGRKTCPSHLAVTA